MRYNKTDMEPNRKKVEELINPDLRVALNEEPVKVVQKIESLKGVESPTTSWLEAMGLRYKLRDFFLEEKAELAQLNNVSDSNVATPIGNFLASLDAKLEKLITGDKPENNNELSETELANQRIDRLIQELNSPQAPKAFEQIKHFTEQDASDVMFAGQLLSQTIEVRNGITERLWSAVQSLNDSSAEVVRSEFEQQLMSVNTTLDAVSGSTMRWESIQP